MPDIATLSANKIKEINKLHLKKYRDEYGLYIAEGYKILEELINSASVIKEIYSTKPLDINLAHKIISESDMKKISTTDSPCEVLSIVKKPKSDISSFKELNKVALLDRISDPGNLGTIIRSACAFGIDCIILYGNCVDLYSPKVIRSTAGNFLKIPIINIKNINEINSNFKNHIKISTSLSNKANITFEQCKKLGKYIVMLGSEADGLCAELTDIATNNIRLDMKNNVESLNLAISASIIFYSIM